MADPYDLQRFLAAQEPVVPHVLTELRAGRKRSHWMWFVFPQARGLGRSPTSMRYGIASLDEAKAYLAHPVLGVRLRQCARLATAANAESARAIFGPPDDLKFQSSMTLFALAAPGDADFTAPLEKYFDGEMDPATVAMFGAE
jgi:uncharacterized protein (DUF1810 family)